MDWARDNSRVSNSDRNRVFKCNPESQHTTIALSLDGERMRQVRLRSEKDCLTWLEEGCPRIDGSVFGLVLMMPGRAEKQRSVGNAVTETGIDGQGPLEEVKTEFGADIGEPTDERAMDFCTLDGNRGGLRTLPFSVQTFRRFIKRFFVHGDIARVVSRGDVPAFSVSEVTMRGYPAYVIHCRTTSAWGMDLAATCTFFPHCMLTFATMFGCTPLVQAEILKRLDLAPEDAAHPLLIPGIIAELERTRHAGIIEHGADKLETRIVELDTINSDAYGVPEAETARKNTEKRNDWLDMSYLRNQLVSWNTQLGKMASCADESSSTNSKMFQVVERAWDHHAFGTRRCSKDTDRESEPRWSIDRPLKGDFQEDNISVCREENKDVLGRHGPEVQGGGMGLMGVKRDAKVDANTAGNGVAAFRQAYNNAAGKKPFVPEGRGGDDLPCNYNTTKPPVLRGGDDPPCNYNTTKPPALKQDMKDLRKHMCRIGPKFAARIREIRDEYDDRVRECDMRLGGMAMASQWAEGETNVQIALEMKRDSRHMRSIALVTMVFLPGTFFSSIFSMTFFNWSATDSSDGDGSVVSRWVWIWVAFTIVATSATFAFWWYFIVYREARARKIKAKASTDEEAMVLDR